MNTFLMVILIYIIGVVLSWFSIAYMNDNDDIEGDPAPTKYIFISWLCFFLCFSIILEYKLSRLPNPTLKIFKRNKKKV